MKLISVLSAAAALVSAAWQVNELDAGKTFLEIPTYDQGAFKVTRRFQQQPQFLGEWLPQPTTTTILPDYRVTRRFTSSQPLFQRFEQPLGRKVLLRSSAAPVQQGQILQVDQNRVYRRPISKTMTILPSVENRVKRKIVTHLPMRHERIKHVYTVEDQENKDVIHHYVEPVEMKNLGLRKGLSLETKTEHVLHRDKLFDQTGIEGMENMEVVDDLDVDGQLGSVYWKILESSCDGIAHGTMVRPKAECVDVDTDEKVDDSLCNSIDFPKDIQC